MGKTSTGTKRYFADCETIEALKKLYHELAKKYHPDLKGGCEATMKVINAEFDRLFPSLRDIHVKKDGTTYTATGSWKSEEMPKEYRDIIYSLIHLPGIDIEICGSWIWVSGEKSKEYHVMLKELGFWFSAPKKAWYYSGQKKGNRKVAHCKNLNEVRNIWGSKKIDKEEQAQIG
jgi:hypothetical protein